MDTADVIVIGLGAVGAATAYQLARRGLKVIGIDRFSPPHDLGSSHGETRITRQAIGEGAAYVPLVLRSQAIWRGLEEETGERLMLACGFLAIDDTGGRAPMHGKPEFVRRTADMAERFGIEHERLTPGEAAKRFPALRLLGSEQIYFEPGGGLVYPERCIAAQLARARALGARLRVNEPVVAIAPGRNVIEVETAHGRYAADRAVLAAGGWTPELVGRPLAAMRLLRQTLHWFETDRPDLYRHERFPTFTWMHGVREEDIFYGFPIVPGVTPGVKLATEQFSRAMARPEALDRRVDGDEDEAMHRTHAAGRLLSLSPQTIAARACFYTNAPDGDFVIDNAGSSGRLTVVSACSGHGFKHSAGLGAHVAGLLAGEESAVPDFALDRDALAGSSA